MLKKFNRGQIPEALARFFGIKGDVAVDFQETLVPNVTIGDVVDSPYLQYSIPVMGGHAAAAAGAGEFGYVGIRPGPNVALQVHMVSLLNTTGASLTYHLRWMTAANVATVGVGSATSLQDVFTGTVGQTRSSNAWQGTHTALVGAGILSVVVPAGESVIVEFPRGGVCLFGNDPNGVPSLGIAAGTDNVATSASFYAREWPLPG